MVVNDRVTAVP